MNLDFSVFRRLIPNRWDKVGQVGHSMFMRLFLSHLGKNGGGTSGTIAHIARNCPTCPTWKKRWWDRNPLCLCGCPTCPTCPPEKVDVCADEDLLDDLRQPFPCLDKVSPRPSLSARASGCGLESWRPEPGSRVYLIPSTPKGGRSILARPSKAEYTNQHRIQIPTWLGNIRYATQRALQNPRPERGCRALSVFCPCSVRVREG